MSNVPSSSAGPAGIRTPRDTVSLSSDLVKRFILFSFVPFDAIRQPFSACLGSVRLMGDALKMAQAIPLGGAGRPCIELMLLRFEPREVQAGESDETIVI